MDLVAEREEEARRKIRGNASFLFFIRGAFF